MAPCHQWEYRLQIPLPADSSFVALGIVEGLQAPSQSRRLVEGGKEGRLGEGRDPVMPYRFSCLLLILYGACSLGLRAEAPPLVARAMAKWTAGREDMAFTQQTRVFLDNGEMKAERIERYDPSLPDSKRWQLIEVNGEPATLGQRAKWEARKNGRPRKKLVKSPAEYLDLDHATLVDETSSSARFEIGFRPEASSLLAGGKIAVLLTIDKASASIVHIVATLREPISVLLGLARITDLDVDVHVKPADKSAPQRSGEVQTGSTARVTICKFGNPTEYSWSDFKRVPSFGGSKINR